LRRNPHHHPLLYLKGVKLADLQAVLNFMYNGEVNVAQEELNSFLALAEDLQVKAGYRWGVASSVVDPNSFFSDLDPQIFFFGFGSFLRLIL
jgi:hypothetical protein